MTRTERGDEAAHLAKLHELLISPPSPEDVMRVREHMSDSGVFFAACLRDPKLMQWINKHRNLIISAIDARKRHPEGEVR